jgi:hypothetical protein
VQAAQSGLPQLPRHGVGRHGGRTPDTAEVRAVRRVSVCSASEGQRVRGSSACALHVTARHCLVCCSHVVNTFLIVYQLGTCCVYVVFVSSNIKEVSVRGHSPRIDRCSLRCVFLSRHTAAVIGPVSASRPFGGCVLSPSSATAYSVGPSRNSQFLSPDTASSTSSCLTTDGQSASLFWRQVTFWDTRPILTPRH